MASGWARIVRFTGVETGAGSVAPARDITGEADAGLRGMIEKQAGQRISFPDVGFGVHSLPHMGQVTLATMSRLLAKNRDQR
jgi:hypothetical protein